MYLRPAGFLTILALLLLPAPSTAQQFTRPIETCLSQLPPGIPQGKPDLRLICRRAYLTAVDMHARIPAWVAYSTNRDSAVGCEGRVKFSPDLSLPIFFRAEPTDYTRSGYDMGHMVPAADMAWDPEVQAESFIMTNVAPQKPNLNRGAWKLLETHVRAWSLEGRRLTIYTGTIYGKDSAELGRGVTIPDQFFKIIVDQDSGQNLAFVMPNGDSVSTKLVQHQISVGEIERLTGLSFPVQGDKSRVGTMWPANIRALAAEKRKECS